MLDADLLEYAREEGLLTENGSSGAYELDQIVSNTLGFLDEPASLDGNPTDASDAEDIQRWGSWEGAKSERWSISNAQMNLLRQSKALLVAVDDPGKDRVDYGVHFEPLPYLHDDVILTRKSRETRPFANLGQTVAPPFPNLLGGLSDFDGGRLEDFPGMDDAMRRFNTMPTMEVALELKMSATRPQIAFLKTFMDAKKALIASLDSAPTSLLAKDCDDQSWLYQKWPEPWRPESPPIFARPSASTSPPPEDDADMGAVADLLGPLGSDIPSPRGKNLSMDGWNKIENIQPFPFSSSAPSQRNYTPPPIWSSTPAVSTPPSADPFEPDEIIFAWAPKIKDEEDMFDMLDEDLLRLPDTESSLAQGPSDDVDELDSDSGSAVPDLASDLVRLVPAAPVATFLKTSSPAAPDPEDILTRARIPITRLPTPPPSPPSHLVDVSFSDFAANSGTPWAFQPTTGLISLTVELSWSIWTPPGDVIWPVWEEREWADEAPMREQASAAEGALIAVLTSDQDDEALETPLYHGVDVEPEFEEPLVARSAPDEPRRHGHYAAHVPSRPDDFEDSCDFRSKGDSSEGQNDCVPLVSSQSASVVDELEDVPPLVPQKRAHGFSQDAQEPNQRGNSSELADQRNSPATGDASARPSGEAAHPHVDLGSTPRHSSSSQHNFRQISTANPKPLLNDQRQPLAPPPKAAWTSMSALSRFIGSRGRTSFKPVITTQSCRAPAPSLAAKHPVAPPPLPRPATLHIPDFLRESSTTVLDEGTSYRIIASPDLLQMPAHFQALGLQRFTVLDRPLRYTPQQHRTLEPHLILDGKTCVIFSLLIKIVGNVCRPEELLPDSAAPTTRDEAVLTTLHRLAGQYDRVLLILEEGSGSSTRAFAYTPPILAALSSLDSAILEHLPQSCTIDVVLSVNPNESAAIIRKLARHLKVIPDEESESWLFDEPTENELKLIEMSLDLNFISAAAIASWCETIDDFLCMPLEERQRTFQTVCSWERMERLSATLSAAALLASLSSDGSTNAFGDLRTFESDLTLSPETPPTGAGKW